MQLPQGRSRPITAVYPPSEKKSRAFGPPETSCHLFQRAAVDTVFGETGVQDLNYRVRLARVGRECHGLCKGIAAQYSSTCTNGSLHEATTAGNGLLVHVVIF